MNISYGNEIDNVLNEIINKLNGKYGYSKKSIALQLLQDDGEINEIVKKTEKVNYNEIKKLINSFIRNYEENISLKIAKVHQNMSKEICKVVVKEKKEKSNKLKDIIENITISPVWGTVLLVLVLYYGLYKFVGQFGAGTIVNFIEKDIFDKFLTPYINTFVNYIIPNKMWADLFVNQYGIITLGIKYAIAIVLPVVGCFFFVFSIIEDSGYLPRVSFLMDRFFKMIGLNGRAVIPMTLGFGCDTMATMVSRTLETKKERIIATILLSLAIPCSAQLGVILGLLSITPVALAFWIVFMIAVFLFIGWLSAKILPGEKPDFFMELPPLRMPKIKNIFKKTYTRMYWYFKEILPLFILASFIIWIGNLTGIFQLIISYIEPLVGFIGLPKETASIFLFGFFRRDYGAAGLLDMQTQGVLNTIQLIVTSVTLTLFVPCVAQFAMMIKERGLKTALAIAGFILPFAFAMGYLVNKLLIFVHSIFPNVI